MKDEIIQRLEAIAYKVTIPFCYSCYLNAPTGRCVSCYSDDLMRLMPGVGCEYGIDWVIRELVREIEPVNADERLEESVRQCYPEKTKIGWLEYDTASAIKELDPVSWDLAKSDWLETEESDDNLMSFNHGSTFHDVSRVMEFCEEKEAELEIVPTSA
jgi:hypothetical protein